MVSNCSALIEDHGCYRGLMVMDTAFMRNPHYRQGRTGAHAGAAGSSSNCADGRGPINAHQCKPFPTLPLPTPKLGLELCNALDRRTFSLGRRTFSLGRRGHQVLPKSVSREPQHAAERGVDLNTPMDPQGVA